MLAPGDVIVDGEDLGAKLPGEARWLQLVRAHLEKHRGMNDDAHTPLDIPRQQRKLIRESVLNATIFPKAGTWYAIYIYTYWATPCIPSEARQANQMAQAAEAAFCS